MNKPYIKRSSPAGNVRLSASGRLDLIVLLISTLVIGSSCGTFKNLFKPKEGCPSNGKNVGAERILSGEKVPKASKFKA